MGPNYVPGKKTDLWVKNIQRTVIMMGAKAEAVNDIPCGNTCALVGVDQYLIKTGTITDNDDAHNIKTMKFSVSAVVRVAVEVKNSADLPKLVEGLKRLSKSDPLVQISQEDTGENIIAGAGELHLEICLNDLQNDFMNGAPIKISDPVVSYRETVRAKSKEQVLSKSPNKHNRLFAECEPMSEALQMEIEEGKVCPAPKDAKEQAKYVAETFGYDPEDVMPKKLWAFGPDGNGEGRDDDRDSSSRLRPRSISAVLRSPPARHACISSTRTRTACPPPALPPPGPNWLMDATRAVQYLNEIKESVNSGFQWGTRQGPLAQEQCRGVILKILDVTLHADAIHRGMGQILPTARRVLFAGIYTADPTVMEPMYLADIAVPVADAGGVYQTLSLRRGEISEEIPRPGTPMTAIRAFVPVNESFGFTTALRAATGGKAFPQCSFDHWQTMNGDPFTPGNRVFTIIADTRTRKGLKPELPPLDEYAGAFVRPRRVQRSTSPSSVAVAPTLALPHIAELDPLTPSPQSLALARRQALSSKRAASCCIEDNRSALALQCTALHGAARGRCTRSIFSVDESSSRRLLSCLEPSAISVVWPRTLLSGAADLLLWAAAFYVDATVAAVKFRASMTLFNFV